MAIKTFKFDKLVRDKTIQRLKQKGLLSLVKKSVSSDELTSYFKAKIDEEAQEVVAAKTNEELLDELADCLDVIDGFVQALGFAPNDLERVRKQKSELRGKFDDSLVIDSVSAKENSEIAQYCKSNPDKYPEINK